MKCAAMQKKQKPKMSREEKNFWNQLTSRYHKLRMTMSHEAAIEQLRKEAEEANAELNGQNTEDNRTVHEVGSNVVEERKD